MSQPGEKKKGISEITAFEYLSSAPLLFGGVALTFSSLGYGLYQMVRGDMRKQMKGMSGRIGFQMATIFAIATTVGYRADERQRAEIEKDRARDERRRVAREEHDQTVRIAAAAVPHEPK